MSRALRPPRVGPTPGGGAYPVPRPPFAFIFK